MVYTRYPSSSGVLAVQPIRPDGARESFVPLDLFTESVIKPDYELRANASYAGCYFELMEIRQHCLAYLKTLKEIHQIETADESDAIEAEKSLMTKTASRKIAFSHGEFM